MVVSGGNGIQLPAHLVCQKILQLVLEKKEIRRQYQTKSLKIYSQRSIKESRYRKFTGVVFVGETSVLEELLKVRLAVQGSIHLRVIAYLQTWYDSTRHEIDIQIHGFQNLKTIP